MTHKLTFLYDKVRPLHSVLKSNPLQGRTQQLLPSRSTITLPDQHGGKSKQQPLGSVQDLGRRQLPTPARLHLLWGNRARFHRARSSTTPSLQMVSGTEHHFWPCRAPWSMGSELGQWNITA